jgi:hypothetical protein
MKTSPSTASRAATVTISSYRGNSLHRPAHGRVHRLEGAAQAPPHPRCLIEVIGFIREMISHRQKRLGNLPERRSALRGNVRR